MPKVTATVQVRGVDASVMLADARDKLTQLAEVDWTITDTYMGDYGPMDEVATRDGMLPMWTGSVTAEADIKEAGA